MSGMRRSPNAYHPSPSHFSKFPPGGVMQSVTKSRPARCVRILPALPQ